jgi:hypothetical protein
MVRETNPGEGEFFLARPVRLWIPPSLLCKRDREFLGDKNGQDVMLTSHTLVAPTFGVSWSCYSTGVSLGDLYLY